MKRNVIDSYEPEVDLEEVQQQYIAKCVDYCGGNIQKAAKLLKIARNTLYRKLDKAKNNTNESEE